MRENGIVSEGRVIKLVMENDHEEYLSYFPEDRTFFQKYIDAHKKMLDNITETWYSVKQIENQKDFAMKVKDLPCSGVLFKMKKDSSKSISVVINTMNDNMKERIISGYIER